jgi:hypothetical protein
MVISIKNINATSTAILGFVNSLSTNSTLSITNLNQTSTSLLGYINTNNAAISTLNTSNTSI